MELNVSQKEAELLQRVLSDYLSTLRELVYKTENYDWRMSYKEDEEMVKSLLERVSVSEPEALVAD